MIVTDKLKKKKKRKEKNKHIFYVCLASSSDEK